VSHSSVNPSGDIESRHLEAVPPDGSRNEEDHQLIRRAQEGDRRAFETLICRHGERLLRMVRTIARTREEAEDIVQDTFAAAFFKVNTFASRSSFFTWLYRIALNKTISRRRQRRLETTHFGQSLDQTPEMIGPQAAPDQILEREEQISRLRQAIARLEADRQTVLALRDVDGKDYSEIAEILNIPIGTVRSRLHRARADLRELLQSPFFAKKTKTGNDPAEQGENIP